MLVPAARRLSPVVPWDHADSHVSSLGLYKASGKQHVWKIWSSVQLLKVNVSCREEGEKRAFALMVCLSS